MFADAKISSLGYPCFYFLIFHFEIDLQLESAVCRSPYERDSIDDQLEMAALHVRWLAASFFSNRPRRFWITWNHLLSGFKTNK